MAGLDSKSECKLEVLLKHINSLWRVAEFGAQFGTKLLLSKAFAPRKFSIILNQQNE